MINFKVSIFYFLGPEVDILHSINEAVCYFQHFFSVVICVCLLNYVFLPFWRNSVLLLLYCIRFQHKSVSR